MLSALTSDLDMDGKQPYDKHLWYLLQHNEQWKIIVPQYFSNASVNFDSTIFTTRIVFTFNEHLSGCVLQVQILVKNLILSFNGH